MNGEGSKSDEEIVTTSRCAMDTNVMRWAPDVHGYIAWATRMVWGVLFLLTFAAGFLTALLWKGIGG